VNEYETKEKGKQVMTYVLEDMATSPRKIIVHCKFCGKENLVEGE
jgi:hypothetical protein